MLDGFRARITSPQPVPQNPPDAAALQGGYLDDLQRSRVEPFGLLLNFALHCLVNLLPDEGKSHGVVC